MQLNGKGALITGGGRGIGRAIALAYSREGAKVALLSRTQAELDQVANEIRESGGEACVTRCDVSDPSAVESAIGEACDCLGTLDLLVNNAGGGTERRPVGDDDPERWKRVVEINLIGTYFVTRACLPYFRKNGGGTVINVGSGMGHEARPGNSSYNVAKAGMWMLTRCLALELWNENITVNELIPGPVYTDLTDQIFAPSQPHPKIPSEWVKQPSEVAPLALFLAQQQVHGPTGQSFSLARRPVV